MDRQQETLGLGAHLRLLMRGYRLMARVTPSYGPLTLLAAFAAAVQPLATLFFSSRVLSELAGARDVALIARYATAAVLTAFLLSVLRAYCTRRLSVNQDWMAFMQVHAMQYEHFAQMDYGYVEDSAVSDKLADMETKARGSGLGLMNLYYFTQPVIQNMLSLVLAVLLLVGMFTSNASYTQSFVTSHWAEALLGLLLCAALAFTLVMRGREAKLLDHVVSTNATANTAAWYYNRYVNVDMAAKDIRLYNQRPALMRLYREHFSLKAWHGFFHTKGLMDGAGALLLGIVGGCVYLLIGLRALAGMYAVGSVVQYVGAVTALAMAAGTLVSSIGQMLQNAPHLRPLLDFLSLPPLLQKGTLPVPRNVRGDYVFTFRNVSFRYPGQEAYALRDLSLTLRAGERMAVVGLNGSGKTTMIKLLCRLYDPTEGEILLDGVDIRDYDYAQYHALFSVVFQDFKLFPLEISQNVAANATPDAPRAERCLRAAGFGERLDRLEAGMDTVLYKSFDKEGVQLSGGEAQKVALARALYKDAPIVVLDEPTAALDPIAEYEVYTTFDKTIGDKTAIFISHRLSSCRFCDVIAVFDEGRLVQRGTHEALLQDEAGRYASLWHAQARHYVDEAEAVS